MAIVLEDEAQAYDTNNVTTLDVVLGAAPTDGWLLVGVATRMSFTDTGNTITGPTGFTDKIDANTREDAQSGTRTYIKYKVASSESDTFTFTNAGSDTSEEIAAWVGAYSGMVTDSFTGDTDFDHSTTNSTSSPSLSVTTTGTLSLIVHAVGFGFGGGSNEYPITGLGYSNSFTNEATVDGRVSDTDCALIVGTRTVTSAAAYATQASWTEPTSTPFSCCMAEFFGVSASAPVANVSADTTPIQELGEAGAVPTTPTVTEGSSAITSVVVSCDTGTITMTASGSVTISNNGTSSVTLQNGASETEYNTVLGTMTHTRSTKGLTTFTLVPSDGTLSDSEQFTRFVRPAGINFSGTYSQIQAIVASLGATLDEGETSGTFVLYVVDDASPTPLSDSQTVTLSIATSSSTRGILLINRRRRKKKSGN